MPYIKKTNVKVKLGGTLWHLVFLSDKGFGGGDSRPGTRGGEGGKKETLLMGDAVCHEIYTSLPSVTCLF